MLNKIFEDPNGNKKYDMAHAEWVLTRYGSDRCPVDEQVLIRLYCCCLHSSIFTIRSCLAPLGWPTCVRQDKKKKNKVYQDPRPTDRELQGICEVFKRFDADSSGGLSQPQCATIAATLYQLGRSGRVLVQCSVLKSLAQSRNDPKL